MPRNSPSAEGRMPSRSGGEQLLWLLSNWQWVHRQVDSVRLTEEGETHRFVSLDATPVNLPCLPSAEDGEQRVLPLALLHKGVASKLSASLDGAALPVLETETNSHWAEAAMYALIDLLGTDPENTKELRELARWAIAAPGTGDPETPQLVRARSLLDRPAGEAVSQDGSLSPVVLLRWITLLESHFVLLVVVPDVVVGRRIVLKYDVDHAMESPRRAWLGSRWFNYPVPSLWPGASYHVEVDLPPATAAAEVRVGLGDVSRSAQPSVRRVHVVIPPDPSAEARPPLQLRCVAAPGGLRTTAWSSVVAVLCLAVGIDLLRGLSGYVLSAPFDLPSGAASVILIAPAALLSWLARTSEHPIAAAVMFSARAMLMITAVLLVGMAALCAVPWTAEVWTAGWRSITVGGFLLLAYAIGTAARSRILSAR